MDKTEKLVIISSQLTKRLLMLVPDSLCIVLAGGCAVYLLRNILRQATSSCKDAGASHAVKGPLIKVVYRVFEKLTAGVYHISRANRTRQLVKLSSTKMSSAFFFSFFFSLKIDLLIQLQLLSVLFSFSVIYLFLYSSRLRLFLFSHLFSCLGQK